MSTIAEGNGSTSSADFLHCNHVIKVTHITSCKHKLINATQVKKITLHEAKTKDFKHSNTAKDILKEVPILFLNKIIVFPT